MLTTILVSTKMLTDESYGGGGGEQVKFYVLGKGIIVSLPRTVAWMVQAIESLTFSTNAAMPMEHTLHPTMGAVHSQRLPQKKEGLHCGWEVV